MTNSQGANLPGAVYRTDGITHLDAHLRGMRRQGRSDNTILARRRTVVLLAEWLGHDPADATLGELEDWQSAMLDKEPAPWGDPAAEAKRYNHLRWLTLILRPYYRDMHRRGIIAADPCALLETPPEPHRPPRPASEAAVDAMLTAEATPRIRDWLLLAMLGLRCVEISRLDGRHFVEIDGVQYVDVHGKGRRERRIGIPTWMWPHLAHLADTTGPCWITRDGRRVSRHLVSELSCRYLRSIGLTITPHGLRHRIATEVLRDTHDVRLVQALLGHANLSSLHIYTEVQPREVAAALERSPVPRALRRDPAA